mmetsp:Transcript_41903/g.71679  ORF Transcript_41903/g.71679 Transcript_41903/m.71679 type:complete len:340 (-) Transcript_41903:280-1299(-)
MTILERNSPKKEVAYRLFEATRFRTLEMGDYVAAKMASHDFWILARVAKRWNSVISYKQLAGFADKTKRDALFKEKVLIQDNDEYNGDSSSESARPVSRQHVLPLPRSYAEANDWVGMRIRKGSRVYAMYPNTTALYCGSVVDSTTYCRNQDDIIVVQFDGDEDDKGVVPERHIPARFVTLIPREFPSSQNKKRRKSSTISSLESGGGASKKRQSSTKHSNNVSSLQSTSSSVSQTTKTASNSTHKSASGKDKLSGLYAGNIGGSTAASSDGASQRNRNYDDVFSAKPHSNTSQKLPTVARHGDPPLKLPSKRKSSLSKRSKKQKQANDNNPNLASSHF